MEMLNLDHHDMCNICSDGLKQWIEHQWYYLPESRTCLEDFTVWKRVMNLLLLEANLRQLSVWLVTECEDEATTHATEFEELRWCPTDTLQDWIKMHFKLTEIQKLNQDTWMRLLLALRGECSSRGINVLLKT